MPRRRAGPARSEAERLISAGAAQSALGRGALHGARQEEVRGGASGARRARARTFLAPRAGAAGGGSPPRRPQAPCALVPGVLFAESVIHEFTPNPVATSSVSHRDTSGLPPAPCDLFETLALFIHGYCAGIRELAHKDKGAIPASGQDLRPRRSTPDP
jgi:hypothetical protein